MHRGIPPEALKRRIHIMSKRKSDTLSKSSQKAEQISSPSTRPHFLVGSRYLASDERVRQFARKYPGEFVITLMPPKAPKPKKKGS